MAIQFKLSGTSDSTFPCIPSGIFEVEAGYPRFRGSNDGQEAELRGWVNYDEYPDFIAQMQPPSTFIGGNMIIAYGAALPGFEYLRVTDWEAERWPGQAPTSDIDADNYRKHPLMYVKLTFRFVKQHATSTTNPEDNPDPAPFLIHRWTVGGQVLSLDNIGLMWDDIRRKLSGGNSEPFFSSGSLAESHASKRQRVGVAAGQDEKINAARLLPHIEHEITWPRVPKPSFTYLREGIGKVNDREVRFRTGRIPKECLLFSGASVRETVMSNGKTAWELVMKFSERRVVAADQSDPGGWNHYFRAQRPSQTFPYLVNDDPETTFTKSLAPGPVPSHALNSDNIWYACNGGPGFYRLEVNPGSYDHPCIAEETDSNNNTITLDLATGYRQQLAIFQQYDFRNLWKSEPGT